MQSCNVPLEQFSFTVDVNSAPLFKNAEKTLRDWVHNYNISFEELHTRVHQNHSKTDALANTFEDECEQIIQHIYHKTGRKFMIRLQPQEPCIEFYIHAGHLLHHSGYKAFLEHTAGITLHKRH